MVRYSRSCLLSLWSVQIKSGREFQTVGPAAERARQPYSSGCISVPSHEGTLAPPGEYIELVLPSAHPNPQSKGGSAFFAQLTAESPSTLQLAHLSPKLPIPIGESGPPSLYTWFLGPIPVLNPNGISISSAVFAQLTRVSDRQTSLLGW